MNVDVMHLSALNVSFVARHDGQIEIWADGHALSVSANWRHAMACASAFYPGAKYWVLIPVQFKEGR